MGKHKKEKKSKHKKKQKDEKKRRSRKSSSSESSDEWVEKSDYSSSEEEQGKKEEEKRSKTESQRDEWMSLSTAFSSESHIDRRKKREEAKRIEKENDQYNPREHVRELNPYWKDGGDGLPKFQKPTDDYKEKKYESSNRYKHASSWKKKSSEKESPAQPVEEETDDALTEKELNALAAKLVKAEIMGKTDLVKELKEKLEKARDQRVRLPQTEDVLLMQTDSKGLARPLKHHSDYGESSGSQKKKQKVETHKDGQRVRYFADDDKHSLQQMFENEKYQSITEQNKQFIKMAGKARKNDDMDDIFEDNVRIKESDAKINKRNTDRAIEEHQKVATSIDRCKFCIQSTSMAKHLMVSLGESAFLCLPPHEPLTEGHCLITPIRHVTCSTLLDENEWEDIMNFRKALTRMYSAKNEDVVFFEMAKNLNSFPHMYIECVPVDKEEGDMAPIYFKKAIDECEAEWAQNKKLVSLKGRDVRKAIPKGLSYFFVSFGMEEGFAHVIEDERSFPHNFAQEIIGGMLDLHHSKWRKPRMQSFDDQSKRVVEFSKGWNDYDCTKT